MLSITIYRKLNKKDILFTPDLKLSLVYSLDSSTWYRQGMNPNQKPEKQVAKQ